MFEIIGIVVVGFIVWSFLKGALSGAVKGYMMRSVDYAVSQGVPRDFALRMIPQTDILKQSMKLMGDQIPDFKAQDVYVQQGKALKMLYKGYLSDMENNV